MDFGKTSSLRWKIFNLIRDDDENNLASNIFDGIIIFLIIINVIIIFLDTFKNIPNNITIIFSYIEAISVIIFSLEYIARVWTAIYIYPNKNHIVAIIKYIFTFEALIDILAIIPFYLPFLFPVQNLIFLRVIRLLRFFRILKLNHYTDAFSIIKNVFKRKIYQLICSLCIIIMLIILSSVLMYYMENDIQPEIFENAFSGLWWAISTVTTVGYGDIYPITGIGKILGAFIAILGVGLIAVPTSILSAGFIEQVSEKNARKRRKKIVKNKNKNKNYINRKNKLISKRT
jgi:voltage-gated potassium channel